MTFTIPIYDLHKVIETDSEGNQIWVPIKDNADDKPWKKFSFTINLQRTDIDYTCESVIWQNTEDPPVKCLKVYLSDGAMVLCALSETTFWERYKTACSQITGVQ